MNFDYDKTTISISNSILKYFGIKNYHKTLNELDEILNKKQYKNVVLLVLDGLGSFNLDDNLRDDSFLRKNKVSNLSTVFPPTTAAATTSLLTGLTPSEHNYIGWDMYFRDSNEVISVFLNETKYGTNAPSINIHDRSYMNTKTIVDLINENTPYKAYYAYPFDPSYRCFSIDDVVKRIKDLCVDNDKKFIYGYVEYPDKLMHKSGIKTKEVEEVIKNLNNKIEELASKVKDTLIIVTADHGLIDSKFVSLKEDYKDVNELIEWISIEPRAIGIKLKEGKQEKFKELYDKYFKNDFKLLTCKEAIESGLFGNKKSLYLEDTIGDFLMIGITDISLIDIDFPGYKANHAGLTEKELTVPFILIDRK